MDVVINGVAVMSVDDAATETKRGVATLWRYIKAGKIETVKTPDRTYIKVSEVERLKRGGNGPSP